MKTKTPELPLVALMMIALPVSALIALILYSEGYLTRTLPPGYLMQHCEGRWRFVFFDDEDRRLTPWFGTDTSARECRMSAWRHFVRQKERESALRESDEYQKQRELYRSECWTVVPEE